MKGIILSGGKGTRLYPMTRVFSKQLHVVYDKPMVYYPLSTLMLMGIREICLISTPQDLPHYKTLFGDGKQWGLSIIYREQAEPKGIAQALIIPEDWLVGEASTLILGDNLFYGARSEFAVPGDPKKFKGALIYGYSVEQPSQYGVIEFDKTGKAISLEEKPAQPKSNYAIPGLYVYDGNAPRYARELKPSKRGEYEITDLNRRYLDQGELQVKILGRGVAWLDTGSPSQLQEAGHFVSVIENRQGLKIACPEEIALRMKFINWSQFKSLIETIPASEYRTYLEKVARDPLIER